MLKQPHTLSRTQSRLAATRRGARGGLAFVSACLVLLVAASFAQTTLPSSPLDQTTPRGTLKLFFLADSRSDGAALKPLVQTANPSEEKIVATMSAKKSADLELTTALATKFPDSTQPAPKLPTEADLAPVFEKIDEATQNITADTATLSASGETAPPFTLKKVGDKWMIPLSVLLPSVEPEVLAQQSHQIEIQINVMKAATTDVNGGKYATRAEAIEGIKKQIFDAAIADHAAAAGAATKPATQP